MHGWMITFSILIWLFCLLLYDVLSPSNLQITLAVCLLLHFCTLCCMKYFCMHGQPIIFHLIIYAFKTRHVLACGWHVPGFLKLFLCRHLYACVNVFVYPPLRLLITSGVIWCDMDPMRLVKQALQLLYGNCSHYR